MNEELDSQLSAMFDDELPPAECELLARRLSRDEALKARWGRYAVIGAVVRAERGVRLNAPLAGRVNAAISAEPALGNPVVGQPRPAGLRWWQPLVGGALAAGVAAASVLWLRAQGPLTTLPLAAQHRAGAPAAPVLDASAGSLANASYVTPATPALRPMLVPSTQLANYVVAHSMVSSPVARRNLLSSFITSEPSPAPEAQDPKDHASRTAP
ncbi:MAG TPA: sigma-E factor negative regulatory protein [Steroidobacteraceae bacterium]|nr:sigma-E factor negative regulatory protein [Steroidobacteraceae bacterium]